MRDGGGVNLEEKAREERGIMQVRLLTCTPRKTAIFIDGYRL